MNLIEKKWFVVFMIVSIALGFISLGHADQENKNPETLSNQDKASIAKIERRATNGKITSTDADVEKATVAHKPLLRF